MVSRSLFHRLRTEAADRQGWRCFWCGEPMVFNPRGGYGTDLEGVSADHWPVKRAHGGQLVEGNVVAAHVRCNSTRADDARPHERFAEWFKTGLPPPSESRKVRARKRFWEAQGKCCVHCGRETRVDTERDWRGRHPLETAVMRARFGNLRREEREAAIAEGTLYELACLGCTTRISVAENAEKVRRDKEIQQAIRRWRDEILALVPTLTCEAAE